MVTANVSLVDGRVISLFALFWINGCGLWSFTMWCILGVVVLHTNGPFSYFLSFLNQEGTKFKKLFYISTTYMIHFQ